MTAPVIVGSLGQELYGVWLVIQQAAGYLAVLDLRPMAALKLHLTTAGRELDQAAKRRLVGASVLAWVKGIPLSVAAALVLIAAAPRLLSVGADYQATVRTAVAIVGLTVLLERILSLPDAVLRGMNIGHKAIAWDIAGVVLSTILITVAMRAGMGLTALAATLFATAVLVCVGRLAVVRRAVPWFGASKPFKVEQRTFETTARWLSVSSFAEAALFGLDLVMIGIAAGPSVAAAYFATGALARSATELVCRGAGGANAGIAQLCGEAENARIVTFHRHILKSSFIVFAAGGVVIACLNSAFVSLWVGTDLFLGPGVTVGLLLLGWLTVRYRIDAVFADALSLVERRAKLTVKAGVAGLLFCGAGAALGGPEGLICGAAATRFWLCDAQTRLLRQHIEVPASGRFVSVREAAGCGFVLTAALVGTKLTLVAQWRELAALGLISGLISVTIAAFVLADSQTRRWIFDRARYALRMA